MFLLFLLYYCAVRKYFLGFLILCLTRVSSCSYVSPGAMEKSKLRSSGGKEMFFCVFGVALSDKFCLKKKGVGLAFVRWQSVWEKIKREWRGKKDFLVFLLVW